MSLDGVTPEMLQAVLSKALPGGASPASLPGEKPSMIKIAVEQYRHEIPAALDALKMLLTEATESGILEKLCDMVVSSRAYAFKKYQESGFTREEALAILLVDSKIGKAIENVQAAQNNKK